MSAHRSKKSRVRKTGQRTKAVREELDDEDEAADGIFTSHAWLLPDLSRCRLKPCLIGISLLSVNGLLLYRNLSVASEIANELTVQEVPARVQGQVSQGVAAAVPAALRGYVLQPSTASKTARTLVLNEADLDSRVAAALQTDFAESRGETFETPAWYLPKQGLLQGQELPYKEMYLDVNRTHGQYKEFKHVLYLSPCDAKEPCRQEIPAGKPLLEKAVMMRTQCSEKEKARNLASKRLVVYHHARESGFFGNAVDNVLPLAAAILGGAKRAGLLVMLVLPKLGRKSLSPSTSALCEALGLDLRHELPDEPHRTVGVQGIAAWDRLPRRALQRAIRSSPLLSGVQAAKCSTGPKSGRCCDAGGLFLARTRGARNDRRVNGAEHLEQALRSRGLQTVPNAEEVPLKELAQKIYQSCCLAGWTGAAMANLLFLPAAASVVEFNPYKLSANWWQWSNALGLNYYQFSTSKVLTAEAGENWARQVFGEAPVALAANASVTVTPKQG